ncbi:MAG: mannose-6-phosphate isomerase-like protein (cupin superfamily) [Paraglaciecola sp.]
MIIKNLNQVKTFVAADKTVLKEVLHPKNGDGDLPFSLAHAYLPPGATSLPHRLTKSEETYTVIAGKGKIFVEEKSFDIQKGSVFVVPKNALQSVENTGEDNLEFYCIVTPPWAEEEEEIID